MKERSNRRATTTVPVETVDETDAVDEIRGEAIGTIAAFVKRVRAERKVSFGFRTIRKPT